MDDIDDSTYILWLGFIMIDVYEHSKVKRGFILMWLIRVIFSVNWDRFHLCCYKRKKE